MAATASANQRRKPRRAKTNSSKVRFPTGKGEKGSHATLATLVENLGSEVLRVLVAPKGLDVKVTEPVIHDPLEPMHFEAGDLVLSVGTRVQDPAAGEVVAQAAKSGAAGVVFKRGEETSQLAEVADAAGVALISAEQEMTWNQLYALLKTAIATSGEIPRSGGESAPVGDLFSLANAVAAMVVGPVTIEDPQSRALAFSSLDEPLDEPRRRTILGRRVPEPWMKRLREHNVFKQLWSTEGVITVELPYKGLKRRLAVAVRSGGEILGSIWVAEGHKKLGKSAQEALAEAGRIAALHLIHHRNTDDLKRRVRADLLRLILDGQGSTDHIAYRLGIDASSPVAVAGFDIKESEQEYGVAKEKAAEIIAINCESFHRRSVVAAIDGMVYGLLPGDESQRQAVFAQASRVVDQAAESLGVEMYVGIGSTVSELRDAPRSRADADRVVRILAQSGKTRVAGIENVQAQTMLLEIEELAAANPQLAMGKVKALAEYDSEQGTAYVETLRAYLDAFGNVGQAAESVSIHPNTFRYRIRRVGELTGIDLDDPDERLAAEIQLRFLGKSQIPETG